jgi:SWI/SNF-related matrix-associated actin-dependent regulator 1 of chromatin subfamily A
MAATMIQNRYPGRCKTCSDYVQQGGGYAAKNGGGRWFVLCRSRACAEQAGIATAKVEQKRAEPVARTLTMEGRGLVVQMEKDFAALPLLRSLPGARFDWDRKAWCCSGELEDRARVLEIADQLGLDVEPALRNTIRPEVEKAAERARQDGRPYGYQVEGIRWLAGRQRALLGDDMGLGKTLQVLMALPDNGRAVIVCPASLKFVWRDEQATWRPDLRTTVLTGKDAWKTPDEGEIVVVNFDILPAWAKPPKKGQAAPVPADVVEGMGGVTLVVDEATAVKNFRAARSQKVGTVAEMASSVWLLTGTPLDNAPGDLYGLLESGRMARQTFGGWTRFTKLFNGEKNRWGGYEWGEAEPEVPEMLRRVMLRRTKAEVLKDLPPKRFQWLTVNGENATLRREMDRAWSEWGDTIESGCLPPFEEFSRLRAKLAAGRVKHTIEIAEQHEEAGKPLVVFSAHRAPVDALGERDGWATVTGDDSKEARHQAVTDFQAGKLKGLALTISAGGTGLTLTAASTMLFVDLDWRPMQNAQAEDRCVRIGQTADSVLIMRMVQDHPLDQHVCRLLAEKAEMIHKAVEQRVSYTPPVETPAAVAATPMFEDETDEELAGRLAKNEKAEREANRQDHDRTVGRVLDRHRGRGFERTADDLTADVREQLVDCFEFMLGRCDGAVKKDGAGFNKPDAAVASMAAMFSFDDDDSLLALWGLLGKYRRQCSVGFPALY